MVGRCPVNLCVCAGVYLSRYSDLLQVNAFTAGATGEIVIFKVMKVNLVVFIILIIWERW